MVIILTVLLSLAWLEYEVTSGHFENHACEGPEVSTRAILSSDDDFWGAILPGLDLSRKVMISPAPIAQVTDLELEVLTKLRSTALRPILFDLMLDLPRVK